TSRQLLGQCQLDQAQALATAGSFAEAIAIANQVAPAANSYSKAQKLVSQWSYRILDLAKEIYAAEGNIATAKAFIAAIPEDTAAYTTAQMALIQLQQDYEDNQNALNLARSAFDEQRWEEAIIAAGDIALIPWQAERTYIIDESRKALSARGKPFLEENAVLTANQVDSYRVPYHEYRFDGEAGKTVVIMMASDDFDPLVQLIGPDGYTLASSDDIGLDDFNSAITLPLPMSGSYVIKATAHDRFNRGAYQLTARYLPEEHIALD
ncbi:MAG: PPC domain-containing protein, partial [Cyanobacteria bacterium J06559_3]